MKKLIPTTIITGFLGVGKTTAIRYLLNEKPSDEVWAVLVNEFGEIGIDGAMLQPLNAHVREVPGGCICCVAGLPMKIALNMMIASTKPDRIIIEPTGLGHPEDIIKTLTGEYYDSVLDVRATITLVDPRKLNDPRYLENANFQDQLAVADIVVANKIDLCSADDRSRFEQWLAKASPAKLISACVAQGELDLAWLDIARIPRLETATSSTPKNRLSPQRELYNGAISLPADQEFLRRENKADGFYSCGWLFSPTLTFNFNALFGWMTGLDVWRAKAVMKTNEGVYIFNAENGVLSVNQLGVQSDDEILDSRLEIIHNASIAADSLEKELLATINR